MQSSLELNLEQLEQRRMMAGDVSVEVTADGDLVIQGDNSDNKLVVTSAEPNNMFYVKGLEDTTINGQEGLLVRGVTDDIRINLRGGDNSILLSARNEYDYSNRFEVDDIRFKSRNGNDIIALQQVTVFGALRANTGGGDDLIAIDESQVHDTRAQSGGGKDVVLLNDNAFATAVQINTSSGSDTVLSSDNTFAGNALLRFGGGRDHMVSSSDTFEGDMTLIGGGGPDALVHEQNRTSTVLGSTFVTGFESEETLPGLEILVQVAERLDDHQAANEYFDLFDEYLD